MKRLATFVIVLICMSTTTRSCAATTDWKQQFAKVSDEYFDQVYFHYAPSNGTMVGYHQYDTQLEDYSAAATANDPVSRLIKLSAMARPLSCMIAIAWLKTPIAEETMQLPLEFGKPAERVLIRNDDN